MGSPDITPGDITPLSLLMKISSILLLATLCLLAQARRVHKPSVSHHLQSARQELEKEASNKINHGPAYKKALTDEEFARKKARYYKKLRLGKTEHRAANTRHDQDNLHLQLLTDSPVRSQIKHKPTNFNKVMKLKSLKPSKKTEKLYKKMLAKEKLRMKKKHSKKQHKQQTP